MGELEKIVTQVKVSVVTVIYYFTKNSILYTKINF